MEGAFTYLAILPGCHFKIILVLKEVAKKRSILTITNHGYQNQEN